MSVLPRKILLVALFATLSACAGMSRGGGSGQSAASVAPAPTPPLLAPYLESLGRMAPGDPVRQASELDATLAAARQDPSSANVLRHALALGSAGHAASNPVEARRLMNELLAGPNTLQELERTFAAAYLREFDARVALYAELARQREESQQNLKSLDATAERRADALATENRQLKRALAEAQRKLEAVAEMERSLLEQVEDTEERPPPP